jgi:hypothetical protein
MTITSLDFETANPSRVSICAAGLAVFRTANWLSLPIGWCDHPEAMAGFGKASLNVTA